MSFEEKAPKFDRSFEEIYRELRARIPRYNPDWTNFNDSDPGVTLLQLFSWLAEMALHRMGGMPRNNYLKFAELLGLSLRPARSAVVRLTFSPKAAEPPRTIPSGSRYSAQVEGSPQAVIFETVGGLDVIGAPLDAMIVFADGSIVQIEPPSVPSKAPFYPLGRNPQPQDALYLGFKPSPANPKPFPAKMRFLALRPAVDTSGVSQRAGRRDVDLVPPVDLAWEYRPRPDRDDWERLNVFSDETVALTRDGYVDVEGPREIYPSVEPAVAALVAEPRYWLRVRLDENTYPSGRPPRLEYFLPNSIDGVHLQSEKDLVLGSSSGRAGQSFDFPKRPVSADGLKVVARVGEVATDWIRVDDFFASHRDSPHFVLDASAGRVTFGDGVEGEIPPAGAVIAAVAWRHGGGAVGNGVAAGAVKTMVTQIAGIEKVTNVRPATGGADEEDVAEFIRLAPARLRSGGRAVTASDFESVALSIDGVRKAKALGGRHPDFPDVVVPGAITVHVVPDSEARPPKPSAELIRSVCRAFDDVRLITTEVYVAAPRFLEVRVEARLFAAPEAAFDQVSKDAKERLDAFLSPFDRKFGENISAAAIYAHLFGSAGADPTVRSVENLLVYVDDQPHDVGRPIEVPSDALVYPGDHLIVVRPDPDDVGSR